MQQCIHFDRGWQVVLLSGLMGMFIVGITPTGQQLFAEASSTWMQRRVKPVVPARPNVLVVTSSRDDQFAVAAAVNPRGYRVLVAETAEAARDMLQSDAGAIGVVVVDTQLAEAGRVASVARSLAPSAKLIKLQPNHRAGDISALLMEAI